MLANARVLGHVFDPLSVFWCYDSDGVLVCVVAEVHNTYGERHAYLLRPDEAGVAVTDKDFYVSPFFDVSGTYELRFTLRPDLVATSVTLRRAGRRRVHRDLPGPAGSRDAPGSGPPAHPPAPHAPAGLGPDPGARHLAVAASPARPPAPTPHRTGRGLTMTVSTSVRRPTAATPPRAPLSATIARMIFEHAVRRVPVRVTYPDGRVLGAGSHAIARVRRRPPRGVLRPARPRRQDRASVRPTWPATGEPGPAPTWPTC